MQLNFYQPSINIENVQAILSQSNQNLSSNAEKCKEFIKMHMNSNAGKNAPPNMAALMSFINQKIESTTESILSASSECSSTSSSSTIADVDSNHLTTKTNSQHIDNNNISADLNQSKSTTRNRTTAIEAGIDLAKLYIDNKLMNLEQNIMKTINKRFDDIEKRQNEQFQLIMGSLQNHDKFIK